MREVNSVPSAGIKSISVIGNYLPRKCGIATFTYDLVESLVAAAGDIPCWAVAMNDNQVGYAYPDRVRFEISQHTLSDYHKAAEFLTIHQADIVSVQHEYGIFGGPAGRYILELLADLPMPVVTTLHTVLVEPSKEYYRVMMQLGEVSDRLVVMSHRAEDILHSVYEVGREKIVCIPHGIPDMPFMDPNYSKDRFGLLGRKILLTFGLLSRNKGIEYVLKALPDVVKQSPDLLFIILGATHPHVLESEGEAYRSSLEKLVKELGLEDHVQFQNHFVTSEELNAYLAAADLYVTPYVEKAQITSGTLAYAMGTGKAVISTPYWYAEEMLSGGRGILVPFRESKPMAQAISRLAENDAERHQMRIRAYNFSRGAVWSEVAKQYLKLFEDVKRQRQLKPELHHRTHDGFPRSLTLSDLPPVRLDHLVSITDDTGVLQHAKYTIANRHHGYCTDDNARALIAVALARKLSGKKDSEMDSLYSRFLSFVLHAYDFESGRFHNFMSYDRRWTEAFGSEDSHGRAAWALGTVISIEKRHLHQHLACMIFKHSLNAARDFTSPRAIAFTLIGMNEYLDFFPGDSEVKRSFLLMSERLYSMFQSEGSDEWPWLEDKLTYANGKLPHALLLAGKRLRRDEMVQAGLHSLEWLMDIQTEEGYLSPVGNDGWYPRGGVKARFDQQPLEANALIEACIAAREITGDKQWLKRAMICINWFLGSNDLQLPLYDKETGGCCDGLEKNGVNQNEGAESTLAWLLSLIVLHHHIQKREDFSTKPDRKPSRIVQ